MQGGADRLRNRATCRMVSREGGEGGGRGGGGGEGRKDAGCGIGGGAVEGP
jgi:hypothetical protein